MFGRKAKADPLDGDLADYLARAPATRPGAAPRVLVVPVPSQTDTVGRRGLPVRWLWRRRRELYAVEAVGALAAVAEWGHQQAAWLWPLWLPAGALTMLAAGLEELPLSPWARWYVFLVSPVAFAWMAAAWRDGITSSAALVGLPVVGVPAVLAWWLHQAPRSRIEIVGGSRWPWRWHAWRFRSRSRREMRGITDGWGWAAKRLGIEGADLLRLVADADTGYELHVELARGQLITDVKAPRLATTLREFDAPAVEAGDREHVIVIRERPAVAVVEEPRPWGAPVAVVPPAVDATGERLDRLAAVLREAGRDLSARKVAARARIPHDWTWKVGLPELERQGLAEKTAAGWRSALHGELAVIRHAAGDGEASA